MKWHVLKRHILNDWRRRRVRVSVSIVVLGIVIFIQYFISRLPQPVVLGETAYSPAISRASQQEIVLHGPILSADPNLLLSFDGKTHQAVEFRAVKAKLTSDSLSFLQNIVRDQYSAPPVELEEVEYLIAQDEAAEYEAASEPNHRSFAQTAETAPSCLTFVAVRAIDGKLPTEIHLYQPEKGSRTFQALEISAVGADLEVLIHQSQPDSRKPEGNPWAAGCKRTLVIGKEWRIVNHGEYDLSFIVPPNVTFRFDFHALGTTSSLQSAGELFEPFVLGSLSLKTKALSVVPNETNSIDSSKPPRPYLSVEASGEPKAININGLRAADAELQLSFSGIGLVEVNGKAVKTLNLGDFVNQNPIIATMFGIVNAALIGWVAHNVFGNKNTTESTGK
jgi:hypothetical protein